MREAFALLQRGELIRAGQSYRKLLGEDPDDRNALLGLATIAVRANRPNEAKGYYQQVLALDPTNTVAQSGLINLNAGAGAVDDESRIKQLLVGEPDSPHLHFALGTILAAQGRWPDAQSAFFHAYSLDRNNTDFVYNLAVSLDQMNQTKPALEYYQEALRLHGQRPGGFKPAMVTERIKELTNSEATK